LRIELAMGAGSFGSLLVERLPVANTPSHELRPRWNGDAKRHRLGQQSPQARMVPAELMTAGIPMLADACPETPDFCEQLLARERFEVLVHTPGPAGDG
jgi:hypothetical protein